VIVLAFHFTSRVVVVGERQQGSQGKDRVGGGGAGGGGGRRGGRGGGAFWGGGGGGGNVSGEEEKRGRRMKNIQEEQFGSTKREDAAQDERKDSFGVCLSVCERPTTASSSVASVSVHAIRDALAQERSGAARRERERERERTTRKRTE